MQFDEIGFLSVILLVILAFATLGFAKGALKFLYGLACLIVTLAAGWAGYTFGYSLILQSWPDIPEYSQYVCGMVSAIIVFLILKTATDFFLCPLPKEEETKKKGSSLLGLVTGIAIGVSFCLLGMDRLIDKGTRAEIDYWVEQAGEVTSNELPKLARLKNSLLKTALGKKVSDLLSPSKGAEQNLTRLAILQATSPENFRTLTESPEFSDTLQNPQILQFLNDPIIKESIEKGDTESILKHPNFITIMENPEMNRAIAEINIEQALKLR